MILQLVLSMYRLVSSDEAAMWTLCMHAYMPCHLLSVDVMLSTATAVCYFAIGGHEIASVM